MVNPDLKHPPAVLALDPDFGGFGREAEDKVAAVNVIRMAMDSKSATGPVALERLLRQ